MTLPAHCDHEFDPMPAYAVDDRWSLRAGSPPGCESIVMCKKCRAPINRGRFQGFVYDRAMVERHPDAKVPEDLEEIGLGMSNFEHEIDDGFAEALQAGRVAGRHAGWNFNGLVWWDAEASEFKEEVYHYHEPQQVYGAATLRQLMDLVNSEWGDE